MADLGGEYDATGGKTMNEVTALPAGEYVATLVKSEKQFAKSGNGNAFVNCEFEVQEGDAQGRRFWTILNLWNNNTTTIEIAQRELNSIIHACGKLRIQDTEELHGIPMRVKLRVKDDPNYGPQNRVVSYKPYNSAPANPTQSDQASDTETAPWKK